MEKIAAAGEGPFADLFRSRVQIRFDGAEAYPAIDYSTAPPADAASLPVAHIRLSGTVPEGTREFTWTYGWTFATYAFTVAAPTALIACVAVYWTVERLSF